jgi:D-alanyl-D-alanine carboxypeptidase
MKFFSIMLLSLLIACSCSDEETVNPGELPADQVNQIISLVDSIKNEKEFPGAIVGVWHGENKFIYSIGVSKTETNQNMEADFHFRIGSVTKTFIATVILQLIDEGKLSLDDKLNSFELAGVNMDTIPNSELITLRQLLNMTSGLYDYADYNQMRILSKEPLRHWTTLETIHYIYGKEKYSDPGIKYHYTNTAYSLLGLIIEKTTGNSFQDEVRTRLIEKYNLSNTSFPEGTESTLPSPYSHGYYYDSVRAGYQDLTIQDVGWAGPAGAMISNIYDLKKWMDVLNGNEVISSSMTTERHKWHTMGAEFAQYGCGMMKLYGFTGHTGGIPGFTNVSMKHVGEDLTIIVFTNMYDERPEHSMGPEEIFRGIARIIKPELIE